MPLTFESNTANLLLEHMSPDEREFRMKKVLGIGNSFLLDQISDIKEKYYSTTLVGVSGRCLRVLQCKHVMV